MAKSLSCRDMGVDCDFTATGNTDEEVMAKAGAHAASAHGVTEMTPEMAAGVKAAIKEA